VGGEELFQQPQFALGVPGRRLGSGLSPGPALRGAAGPEPRRGLQPGAPAPLPAAEPLPPGMTAGARALAALVICAGDDRALASSQGSGKQTQRPPRRRPRCEAASSPAAPPPVSALAFTARPLAARRPPDKRSLPRRPRQLAAHAAAVPAVPGPVPSPHP